MDLDIAKLEKEVEAAVCEWIADLERDDPGAQRLENVRQYLPTVAVMDRPIRFNGAMGVTSAPAASGVSV